MGARIITSPLIEDQQKYVTIALRIILDLECWSPAFVNVTDKKAYIF